MDISQYDSLLKWFKQNYMISYAQCCEDIISFKFLSHIDKGKFIDIGCADPKGNSASYLFYKQGWRGLNIDARKNVIDDHKKVRPEDINICVGMSNKSGRVQFWERGDLSTTDEETVKRLGARTFKGPFSIDVVTLTSLLDSLEWADPIHYLKIDVEKYEKEVIEGIDFKKYRPWLIVVEATLPGTEIPSWDDWENILIDNNYQFVFMHSIDRYYIANEKYDELMNNFKSNHNLRFIEDRRLGQLEETKKLFSSLSSTSASGSQPLANQEKASLPYVEIHVVDHCNLNCKGCSHFCPLVKEPVVHSLECLERDIKTLAKKVNLEMVRVMGGEPLLHPKINEILIAARTAYPKADLRIVTNGVLVPAMKQDFYETIKSQNVGIDVSQYPIVKNYPAVFKALSDNNVKYRKNEMAKFFAYLKLNPIGTKEDNYAVCPAKKCTLLHNGRLYPCAIAAFVPIFNKRFNENIPSHPGLDIYKMTKLEIEEMCGNSFATCEYCNFSPKYFFESDRSKLEKSEWIIPEKDSQNIKLNKLINDVETGQINKDSILNLLEMLEQIDGEAYYSHYPDVRQSGMDAKEHYLKFGHRENRHVEFK